jgi:uncharacterized membrane protein YedE/YeeE
MNHLKRLLYSALTGLIVALAAAGLATHRHKALAAQAAAAHQTTSHLTAVGAPMLGVAVAAAVFIVWDIAAERRRSRAIRALRNMGGEYPGGGW